MRRGRQSTCVLALLASLAVASFVATPAAGRAVQLTQVKIVILRIDGAGQAMYAKHRGMFRKQGIDAELKPLADVSQIVPALLSGEVQFSLGTAAGAALLKSKGAPVKVVAAALTYDPKQPSEVSAVVAGTGKGIARPRDLVGKTIAVEAPTSTGHLGVLEWLEHNGVDPKDVKITYVPFEQMLAPLAQGTIDAAYVVEPYLTQALQAGANASAFPTGPCARKSAR